MSDRDRGEGEQPPGWVVTGTGMVSSLGGDVAAAFEASCRGGPGWRRCAPSTGRNTG